ncbi:MAG: recombinase family protein [Negativicutes bacterium]|nr:recombinase family protein [Negativicutes bacterium]
MASISLYPYGYKLSFLGKKEVHEERAAVVRLIYQKYIEGMNRYAITWYLINHKILRPRGDACDWHYSMVNKILQDERYIGTEKYPPILTQETFEAAQEVRRTEKEKAVAKRHGSCNSKRKYPFSLFIKCGSCGRSYVRGIQGFDRTTKKASWRCKNNQLKNDGKCKASGNIYEEILEVVCVDGYNKARIDFLSGRFAAHAKSCLLSNDSDPVTVLIQETIDQMKAADEERLHKLQIDLNILINKRTTAEWEATPLDLSDFETEKIKIHFTKNPGQMTKLDIEQFKEVFANIIALEPGKLKLVLKNGSDMYQEYKPMKGQVNNAKKYRDYTCKADK